MADPTENNEEVSLKDILITAKKPIKYLSNQWWKMLIAIIVGSIAGISYAKLKSETFTARLSIMLEESRGGGGGLASLAGQFGFDLNGLTGSNGLMSTDNVTLFFKSTDLNSQTLLTPYDSAGKYSLADRYAEIYNLRSKWKNTSTIGQEVFFPIQRKVPFTRLQDSLLKSMVNTILEKNITISRPDKKASFIELSSTMRDELLAKLFCERLVSLALDRYIEVKTKRQFKNIGRLQKQADSIFHLLKAKTYSSASAQERILDLNPALRSETVSSEMIGRDKMMLTTIYGEVIKNLELSKVVLSQETPVMQIVDNVTLPLKRHKVNPYIAAVVGALVLLLITVCLMLTKYFLIAPRNK